MTRAEYLHRLEQALRDMPDEERRRAMEYYEHYFDEADSEQAALDALGAPEKAAADILRDFQTTEEAHRLERKSKRRRNCLIAGLLAVVVCCSGAVAAHYTISNKRELLKNKDLAPEQEIRSLNLEIEGSQVLIQTGEEWRLDAGKSTTVDLDGSYLYIGQRDNTGLFQRQPGQIILTVPPGEVNVMNISVATGDLEIQHFTIPERFSCNMGTGSAVLNDITSEQVVLYADDGEIIWNGTIAKEGFVNCDTGSIDINLGNNSAIGYITGDAGDSRVSVETGGKNFIEAANLTKAFAYSLPGTTQTGKLEVTCKTGNVAVKVKTEEEA